MWKQLVTTLRRTWSVTARTTTVAKFYRPNRSTRRRVNDASNNPWKFKLREVGTFPLEAKWGEQRERTKTMPSEIVGSFLLLDWRKSLPPREYRLSLRRRSPVAKTNPKLFSGFVATSRLSSKSCANTRNMQATNIDWD